VQAGARRGRHYKFPPCVCILFIDKTATTHVAIHSWACLQRCHPSSSYMLDRWRRHHFQPLQPPPPGVVSTPTSFLVTTWQAVTSRRLPQALRAHTCRYGSAVLLVVAYGAICQGAALGACAVVWSVQHATVNHTRSLIGCWSSPNKCFAPVMMHLMLARLAGCARRVRKCGAGTWQRVLGELALLSCMLQWL
jgi:hypothetical protein